MAARGPGEAIELGVTYLSVVGETRDFAESVRKAVRKEQAYLNTHPLKVKADIDVSHIGHIEIPVHGNTDRFTRDVREAITRAQTYATRHPIDIRANVDVVHTSNVTVDVHPDFTNFAVRVETGLALEQARHNWSISIGTNLDTAGAVAQMAALQAILRSMARPIDQEVNIDADRGAASVRSLSSGLGSLAPSARTAGITAAVLLGIVPAAGAALGAVGALGVGLAALGPAAAAAVATIAVGLQGVGDAFKALGAASDSAAADAKAQGQAIAAAEDQLISAYEQRQSAIENVADAQRTLTGAQKDARDAVKDIATAYKDATNDLEDYNFAVKDASLSEAEAKLALQEARDEFAKAPPQDREKAYLRLQRADLRYQQSVEKNKDTQAEANDALAKGVEGSDKVVAAKDRAAKADERVETAQRGIEKANQQVEKANRQVEKAQQALLDATTKTSAAQDKAAQALAKLSPNAREFVLAARAAKPAWEDLKNSVQDKLFDGAASGINDLVKNSLPTLKTGMGDVAGAVNSLTKDFSTFWQAPQNLAGIQSIFAGTADFIKGMSPGLQQATTGFLSLGQAFEPVADKVGAQFGGMLGQIGQAFTDTFENGQLTQLLSTFGDILEGLGKGLKPLIEGLIQMGNIVGPTLGPFFEAFGQAIKDLAPTLGQLGATFVQVLTAIMPDLTNFIAALAVGLEPVLPVIGDLLQSLMTALTPMIGPLSQIAQVVGTALSQAITALTPAIGPLSESFASLITAIAPILPVIAEVAAGLITAIAPALKVIFDALGPVIKQWADLMMPVFRQLQPILADVAMKIGGAIADALVAISPYIPDIVKSFSELVMALVPLLPQLVQLGVDLLPPMIELFIAILPQVLKLIDAFTWLANNVLVPILIPAIQGLSAMLTDQLHNAATAVTTARDLIGGALDKLGTFFTALPIVAGAAWDELVRRVARGVRTIGELLQKAGSVPIPFPGREAAKTAGDGLVSWADDHKAMGGLLRGRGTGTSDSMLIAASNGEYVVNAKATARNTPLLDALNAGWVPSAEFVRTLLVTNGRGYSGGGMVTDSERARMGGGTVNLSIWQAIKNKFPNATLNSAKTDHDVDGGFHPKGDAIDVSPDRAVLDYLWSNRDQLAQIIFDDPNKVWYNVNGERAEGAKARAIYTEKEMKQHGNHIHVAALKEFKDTSIASAPQRGTLDKRTEKEKVVDAIVAVGKAKGASDEAIIAALSTGLVESELKNLDHGPDTSVGTFQQQNFDEWTKGGQRDRMKVSDAALSFFEHYEATDPKLTPGQRAQSVQRSAFPDKYNSRMPEATQLYKESQTRSSQTATPSSDGSSPAGTSAPSTASATPGSAQPVFVTNWPAGGTAGLGGPAATSGLTGTGDTTINLTDSGPAASSADALTSAATPATFSTPEEALRAGLAATPPGTGTPEEEALRATLAATPSPGTPRPAAPGAGPGGAQGGHPLANLPIPMFDKLFAGPAPWYMAATPEAAVANLGTQAASLAQRTGSDVMGFFQNNWKEMLGTGLAVAGMGIGGGGGAPQMINTFNGMDPHSAAAAVERVQRRRTLANQRGGGFGR